VYGKFLLPDVKHYSFILFFCFKENSKRGALSVQILCPKACLPTIGLAIWLNAQLQSGFGHGSLIWIHNSFCYGDLVVLIICVNVKSKVKQYICIFFLQMCGRRSF
jgi:hypothetical protein